MEMLDGSPLKWILFLGNLFFSFSFFLFLLYVVQVQGFTSRTKKYKFVSERESQALLGSSNLLAISVGLYAFVLIGLTVGEIGPLQYIVSGFFALLIGFALGYVLRLYLSYYHPFILEKRLKDIRFNPMKSPETGKPMTLLNEEQEDVHLTREMIEDEETLSVDYDVWLDKETGYKLIERYNTRFHPLICESCNFRTLMERKSEVIKKPREHQKGLLRKHYECSYCGHLESRDVDLSSWEEDKKYDKLEKDIL